MDGIAARIGTVHTVEFQAALDAVSRLGRRLLDAAVEPAEGGHRLTGFMDGYGQIARTGAFGDVPGSTRRSGGFEAGIAYALAPALQVGAAVDSGQVIASLADVGEQGVLRVTQGGLWAAGHAGGGFVDLMATLGSGDANTTSAPIDAGQIALAQYRVSISQVAAEGGYHAGVGGFTLTPSAGIDWRRASRNGFAETGSTLALAAPGQAVEQRRYWVGLALGGQALSRLDWEAHGRAIMLDGPTQIHTPVIFVGGSAPLTVDGEMTGKDGEDFGGSLSLRLWPHARALGYFEAQDRDRYIGHRFGVGLEFTW